MDLEYFHVDTNGKKIVCNFKSFSDFEKLKNIQDCEFIYECFHSAKAIESKYPFKCDMIK